MNKVAAHLALPFVGAAAIAGLYFTPVSLIGCANRGLLAITVVFLSLGAAFVTVGRALRLSRRDRQGSRWWIVTTVILLIPAVLVLRLG